MHKVGSIDGENRRQLFLTQRNTDAAAEWRTLTAGCKASNLRFSWVFTQVTWSGKRRKNVRNSETIWKFDIDFYSLIESLFGPRKNHCMHFLHSLYVQGPTLLTLHPNNRITGAKVSSRWFTYLDSNFANEIHTPHSELSERFRNICPFFLVSANRVYRLLKRILYFFFLLSLNTPRVCYGLRHQLQSEYL